MIQPWRTLSSERPLHDRWIDVRADRCVTAAGVEVAPYYVLDYPDWVHVVALTPDDRLVLVEQYRHAARCVCLELPGGAADPGDVDPIATARRELREETGFDAADWQLVSSLYPNPATHTNRVHTVLATGCFRASDRHLEASEVGMELRCMPVAEVLAGLAGGLLGQSMQVAGLLLALSQLGRVAF